MNFFLKASNNIVTTPFLRLLSYYLLGAIITVSFKHNFIISKHSFLLILLMVAISYLTRSQFKLYELLIFVFAIINTSYHLSIASNHYSNFLNYPNENKTVRAKFKENYFGKDKQFSTNSAQIEINEILLNKKWIKTKGKTLFIPKGEFKNNSYYKNTLLETQGTFYKLQPDNNYERSLIYKGYTHKFYFTKIIKQTPQSSNFLTRIQKKITQRITHNINENKQGLLVAMCLGFKNALSYHEKQSYKNSGIMHIFAVSGLHIGILFSILILFTKCLLIPTKLRYVIVPFILLIYVIIIGCPASAMRAWLMLSVWSLSYLFLRPSSGINNICIAAFIILVFNPLSYLQGGFQYSFLIVTLLVLANNYFKKLFVLLKEKKMWGGKPSYKNTIGIKFTQFILIMLVAWIASIPLNLHFSYQLIPNSFFINLLLGFVVWLILFFAFLKVFFINLFATPINFLLGFANDLSNTTNAELNISWGEISNLSFFLYYLLIILALWLPIYWRYRLVLVTFALIIIVYPRINYNAHIYCSIQGGELIPQITYLTNQKKAIIINAPNYISAVKTKKHIQKSGLKKASMVIFPNQTSQYQKGIKYLDLPQQVLSTPAFNKNTSLKKFYLNNNNWKKRWKWGNNFKESIKIKGKKDAATITFKRISDEMKISYKINFLQSIKIKYEFWRDNKLIKENSITHYRIDKDKQFIINLPKNFLPLL